MTTLLTNQTLADTPQEASGLVPAVAAWTLNANDEMRIYLGELLDHEAACGVENCEFCQSAHHVYALVRSLIYSEVIFPDVTIAERGRATVAVPDAARAGASSLSWAA